MKKIFIVFVFLLMNSSFAFAQGHTLPVEGIVVTPSPAGIVMRGIPRQDHSGPHEHDETAKMFLTDGQIVENQTIDATGYMHGIEMNVPGTAYLINVWVVNAGTGFLSEDGKHGDGRGVVASVPGAHIIVTGGYSKNNSEDGYRATGGGKVTIIGSEASGHPKNGFFVGVGSEMVITNGKSHDNKHGALGASDFLKLEINGGDYYDNWSVGVEAIQGEEVTILGANITGNNTFNEEAIDHGGVSIVSVRNVQITNTVIKENNRFGFYLDSESWGNRNDVRSRVNIEGSTITNNGTVGIQSQGDSEISISTSILDGLCLETADAATGQVGIITVDGEGVDGSSTCPSHGILIVQP